MNHQITVNELLNQMERTEITEITIAGYAEDKVYMIPQDVWENRCSKCVHKNAMKNIPVPVGAVHKHQYAEIIPCRIMSLCRPNEMPGECMSFAPKIGTYGICDSCRFNNHFSDGFCSKEDHAPQRRVYWGGDYGGDEKNRDYWGRHRFSVCDDYEPDNYASKEAQHDTSGAAGVDG